MDHCAVRAGVTTANDSAIYAGSIANLHLVLREGDSATSIGAGIAHAALDSALTNNSGDLLYSANVTGPGVTSSNNRVVVAKIGATDTLVARTGNPAPEAPGGYVFQQPWRMTITSGGTVAFAGTIKNGALQML
jgi:hypothetical protein